ncbi:MAG: dethiobiotin synthase [Lachnospiraceae bacterium]|nr:dethiobiotin synthase [Lachnospiraceae bacterium]
MAKKIFITGTGTDMGKTFVTGLIVKKLKENGINAAYYKAAMSGNERIEEGTMLPIDRQMGGARLSGEEEMKAGMLLPGDALYVKQISGIAQPLGQMCPCVYETAVSPHLAARIEGGPVVLEEVVRGFEEVCSRYDYVTMEGSGGIVCPLCFDERELWLEDVIKELSLSSLIVADAGLGTINSVVLTVEYMRAKGLPVKGIIFNRFHPGDRMEEDNLRMCEYRTKLPVLACVEEGASELPMEIEKLLALYEDGKDI